MSSHCPGYTANIDSFSQRIQALEQFKYERAKLTRELIKIMNSNHAGQTIYDDLDNLIFLMNK